MLKRVLSKTWKRQHREWEQIFASHAINKVLISRMRKEFSEFSTKRQPNFKMGGDLNTHFSLKDTQMTSMYMKTMLSTISH